MGTFLIRERYKVIRTLWKEEGFAAVEAVDIQDREMPTRLLDLYEGPLLHRFGRAFSQVRPENCPAFHGVFLERQTLVAVFDTCPGTPIDQLFYVGDRWSWQDRLYHAGALLHQALLLTDLPTEIACAALRSENVRIDPVSRSLRLRFLCAPMEAELDRRELALLAQDQLMKFLPCRLSSPELLEEFQGQMRRGVFPSMVPLYARWRELRPLLERAYEDYDAKNIFQKAAYLIGRWSARRKRGGR